MTYRSYQDEFNICHLLPELRETLNEAKNRHLAWLGERGFQVHISRDPHDLAAFWRQHRGGKNLLEMPYFDTRFWPNASQANTLILFLEHKGELIGSCGFRLIDLFDRRTMQSLTLREAIKSRHFFYLDPAMGPEGETADCHGHVADLIQDCVICIMGSAWIRPDLQGLDLFKAFGRLARLAAVAAADFLWSWAVTIYVERNRDLALSQYGMTSYSPLAVTWRGEKWWMAVASRGDVNEITLAASGRPLDAPFTW